eukprot:6183584-Pleurochrysis_carterae.AAC.2
MDLSAPLLSRYFLCLGKDQEEYLCDSQTAPLSSAPVVYNLLALWVSQITLRAWSIRIAAKYSTLGAKLHPSSASGSASHPSSDGRATVPCAFATNEVTAYR